MLKKKLYENSDIDINIRLEKKEITLNINLKTIYERLGVVPEETTMSIKLDTINKQANRLKENKKKIEKQRAKDKLFKHLVDRFNLDSGDINIEDTLELDNIIDRFIEDN